MSQAVVLVGDGARARAWGEALRSAGAEVVAVVARGGSTALNHYPWEQLDAVLAAHPEARVAAALPPREGTALALRLAVAGRVSLVEAPLDEALADEVLAAGAAKVRVAHGHTTLGGLGPFSKLLRELPARALSLEVRGLPEEPDGDLTEVLIHALALVRRLSPRARVVSARLLGGSALEATFAGVQPLTLRVVARGQSLAAHGDWSWGRAQWRWSAHEESVGLFRSGQAGSERAQNPRLASLRAVGQLLFEDGDTLEDAAEVLRLARSVFGAAGQPPPSLRRFRQAASLIERRPAEVLAQLGLVLQESGQGAASLAIAPRAAARLPQLVPDVPVELWTFRAGLQPVVFLTLERGEVERTLALFGEVHVERRERRVEVGALDTWQDQRQLGEPRVELYLSREPALARRAAELQAEGDPSAALAELGHLLGYPSCCVAAFAAQAERANNTANRYATVSHSGDGPWFWELNNLYSLVVPFFPCSYRCPSAQRFARAALGKLGEHSSEMATTLASFLRRPVLYFSHDRFLVLAGEAQGDVVRFSSAAVSDHVEPAFEQFARVFSMGGELRFSRESLELRGPLGLSRWRRTDPALGFLASFEPAM